MTYLPEDLLVKVDRDSKAVSLEARAPFLDHRVVELALRLPLAAKLRGWQGKWILRELLSRYVPRSLFERPKMGFGVPIGRWLRGPLRDWAGELLAVPALRESGVFEPEAVHALWREHERGTRDWQFMLWDVLMFESWRRGL